jgi:hypothetical protein
MQNEDQSETQINHRYYLSHILHFIIDDRIYKEAQN